MLMLLLLLLRSNAGKEKCLEINERTKNSQSNDIPTPITMLPSPFINNNTPFQMRKPVNHIEAMTRSQISTCKAQTRD